MNTIAMNTSIRAVLWIAVYAVLAYILFSGIAFLVKAVKARIVKVWAGGRVIAAALGLAAAVANAVIGFSSAAYYENNAREWERMMGARFEEYMDNWLEIYSDIEVEDPARYVVEQAALSGYYEGEQSSIATISVMLGIFFLFSCLGGLRFITERGIFYKGMLKPEEITAELRDGKINIYLASDKKRITPVKALRASPDNLAALGRFIEWEESTVDS